MNILNSKWLKRIGLCFLFFAMLVLSSCARQACAPIGLDVPALLYIPMLYNSELKNVSDDTYRKIALRDLNNKTNIKTLTAVINSTKKDF